MNEITYKLLSTEDKFPIVLVDHLLTTKKECRSVKKQEIQDIFIKAN